MEICRVIVLSDGPESALPGQVGRDVFARRRDAAYGWPIAGAKKSAGCAGRLEPGSLFTKRQRHDVTGLGVCS